MKSSYYFSNLAAIFGRFSLVGIITTGIYLILASLLIWSEWVVPIIASSIAFIFTIPLSFRGHGSFTFQIKDKKRWQINRYIIYTLFGFIMSNIIMYLSTLSAIINAYIGVIIVTMILPILNFLVLKFFVFKNKAIR
jgi:putative flippase GtrA